MSEQIAIRGETIRLGQLLKLAGIVDSGAEARELLALEPAIVNGIADGRRGRQLRSGDSVQLRGRELLITGETDDPGSAAPAWDARR